jgi:hypothetical protein
MCVMLKSASMGGVGKSEVKSIVRHAEEMPIGLSSHRTFRRHDPRPSPLTNVPRRLTSLDLRMGFTRGNKFGGRRSARRSNVVRMLAQNSTSEAQIDK